MSFIGALNFYTNSIDKLHINLKPFYDLLHENTPWNWTDEHERLFQTLKTSFTSDTELTIPNTKHQYKTNNFYYSRRFTYWIRRCPFPIE